MKQSQRAQSPSSTSTAPDRTAAPPFLQVVFENPQARKAQARKTSTRPSLVLPKHFTSLLEDLAQENGQLKRRRQLGLADPANIRRKLIQLEKIDLIHYPYQKLLLDHWGELIIIGATIVDSYLGNKDTASSTLAQLYRKQLSRETITRDRMAVFQIVRLIDDLYFQWKHNFAFEILILLDTPISVLRQQSALKFNKLKLLVQQHTPYANVKSSLPLYIPFLIALLRPQYTFIQVKKALQTRHFNQSDCDAFRRAIHESSPQYDAIRDSWTKEELLPAHSEELLGDNGFDMTEFIDFKGNYPAEVPIQVPGFKQFTASRDLQQRAAEASQKQRGCIRTNASLFAYDWADDIHGPVVEQAVQDLANYGYLKPDEHGCPITASPDNRAYSTFTEVIASFS
ncbi:hypothetical protein F66182_8319 [Fusarium sp. NRRL 66182]|nr:hypothetical protein F66182_8319 [Fusarium sp. NRRL 66182]